MTFDLTYQKRLNLMQMELAQEAFKDCLVPHTVLVAQQEEPPENTIAGTIQMPNDEGKYRITITFPDGESNAVQVNVRPTGTKHPISELVPGERATPAALYIAARICIEKLNRQTPKGN